MAELWDCVKVKVQSQNAPATTHQLSLAQLEDSQGHSSLSQLQDAILSSALSSGGGLDLKLSLSYLDPEEGDLVPLASQDEWETALEQQHSNGSKALLVLAQVLEQPKIVSSPSSASRNGSSSNSPNSHSKHSNNPSNLEQRLARMEDLLLAVSSGAHLSAQTPETSREISPATTNGSSVIDSDSMMNPPSIHRASGTMTPTRSGKDYTELVKNHQASLTTRLNKVKQMNNLPGATSPARTSVTTATNTHDGDARNTATTNQLDLQGFLDRMVRERQEGMQQLMESRTKDLQEWSQSQDKLQTTIQQALEQQQSNIEATLKEHKTQVAQLVNERLEKLEQHRLVAQARDSVAASEVIEQTTQGLTTSINDHLEQWEQTLQQQQSNQKVFTDASTSSTASVELAVKELSTWVQERLLHMEQRILQSQSALSSSSSPPPSNGNTTELTQALTTMINERLDSLQQHMDTVIHQRVDDLAQQIQSQSLRQMSLQQRRTSMDSTVSNVSNNNNINNKDEATTTRQALTAVVDDRLASFQRHVDQALQQLAKQSGTSAVDLAKLAKLIKTSQDTILANQKQYASALRQTAIRLHNETQKHVTSAASLASTPDSSSTSDWETAKQVILSSHDELRESHEENMTEQKNYLVECIEMAQKAILNRLTTMDINNAGVEERVAVDVERIQAQATAAILDRIEEAMARRQRWSSSSGGDAGETTQWAGARTPSAARSVLPASNDVGTADNGLVGEELEELVLGAMEKLEEAMVANCEHIQAQATAAILDKVETSQKTVEDKVDHSQGVLLNKMIKSHSILVETVGSGHATVVDTIENNQAALECKLSASQSILQLLQSRAENQQQQAQQTRQQIPAIAEPDLTRRRPEIEQVEPLNDMDGSRHGELRRRYDLDGSRNSHQVRRKNDLDDSRMSILSPRGIARPSSPKVSSARPKVSSFSVQRFLDMDTRSQLLEHAYDCIKFNRPLSEDVPRASFASGGESEENERALKNETQAVLRAAAAVNENDDDGGNSSGGGDWI